MEAKAVTADAVLTVAGSLSVIALPAVVAAWKGSPLILIRNKTGADLQVFGDSADIVEDVGGWFGVKLSGRQLWCEVVLFDHESERGMWRVWTRKPKRLMGIQELNKPEPKNRRRVRAEAEAPAP